MYVFERRFSDSPIDQLEVHESVQAMGSGVRIEVVERDGEDWYVAKSRGPFLVRIKRLHRDTDGVLGDMHDEPINVEAWKVKHKARFTLRCSGVASEQANEVFFPLEGVTFTLIGVEHPLGDRTVRHEHYDAASDDPFVVHILVTTYGNSSRITTRTVVSKES